MHSFELLLVQDYPPIRHTNKISNFTSFLIAKCLQKAAYEMQQPCTRFKPYILKIGISQKITQITKSKPTNFVSHFVQSVDGSGTVRNPLPNIYLVQINIYFELSTLHPIRNIQVWD